MADLYRQIRSTLKPFKVPKQEHDYLIAKRLGDANIFLLNLKASYPKVLKLHKAIIYPKDQRSIPLWMERITPILQSYLDTYIIRTKYLLHHGETEPIAVYEAYGTEEQVKLIKHYILYIYESTKLFGSLYQKTLAQKAKGDRKEARDKGLPRNTKDIRVESSNYKRRLIKSIVDKLGKILEEAKLTDKAAHYRGLSHQERIDKYMKAKYSTQWKTRT